MPQITLDGSRPAIPEGIITSDIHPLIISASRETDIPAFYMDWFIERFYEGYILWKNPYNPKRGQQVILDRCRGIVFWTKDPAALLHAAKRVESLNVFWYAQITLNDYEKEGYEPAVPSLESRIAAFQELSRRVGPDRVVWRYDPFLVSDHLTIDDLLVRISSLWEALSPYTRRMVFSFIDIEIYRGVKRNLSTPELTGIRELSHDERSMVIRHLAFLNRDKRLLLMACSEDEDYSSAGVVPGCCIDSRIFAVIGREDPDFLSDLRRLKKAKGQRPRCTCIESKDIGEYSTCPHLCVYCYANRSSDLVRSRYTRHHLARRAGMVLPSIVPGEESSEYYMHQGTD